MADTKPRISMIVAVTDKHRAIGEGGKLLFPISEDLRRFKRLTTGHPVIMGRKTFESIGKALPNRKNFVVSRNLDFKPVDMVVCSSLEFAIKLASEEEMASSTKEKEVFIIGGGEIYHQALPITDRIYLTLIESDATGGITFPDYSHFTKVIAREHRIDEKTGLKYHWIDLER